MEELRPAMQQHHRNRPRRRCGECEACLHDDCGKCRNCVRFTKFGGDGSCKNVCVLRRCRNLQPPPNNGAPNSSVSSPQRHKEAGKESFDSEQYSDSSKSAAGDGEITSGDGSESEEEKNPTPRELPCTSAKAKLRIRLHLKKKHTHPKKDGSGANDVLPSQSYGACDMVTVVAPPNDECIQRLYGQTIPRHKGRCAGCLGSRDSEARHEAILLCDGMGCSREYHLGCVEPPLTEVPEGEFYCFDCDPEGTAKHLLSYFEDLEEERADFRSSRDFVEHLLRVQMSESDSNEASKKKAQQEEEYPDDVTSPRGLNEKVAKKRKRSFSGDGGSTTDAGGNMRECGYFDVPPSEISKISKLHNAALKEVTPLESENHEAIMQVKEIGPDLLVGKLVRLYCPADNNYHTGRIVDWRSASNIHMNSTSSEQQEIQGHLGCNSIFHGRGNIASSEFLVRFPSGIEGRKKLLLRWLVLEEHSLAVSFTVIWGQLRKGRGLSGWRPAQTLIRTSLELVPVRHLLETETSSEQFSLALFFGEESHVYLRLRDEAVDFFSPMFAARLQGSTLTASSSGNKSGSTSLVSCSSTQMDASVCLALTEIEEQKRAFTWHNLPLKNPAHARALSVKDEFAIPQLMLPSFTLKDGKGKQLFIGAQHCTSRDEVGEDANSHPQLCPLIQHGLDRLWLSHLLDDKSAEKSIDTLESIRLLPCSSPRAAIAIISEKK
mmetsp:Transcript_8546/g.25774  ORF Transcript_8546/g.25774 Transcript_8546/m.25774 type:complete len:718 (-) Transcript_8546:28-2181(-)